MWKEKQMKDTGIVRKVDDLGRVTLAKEDRRILGINDNDPIIMVRKGQEIRIRKFQETCIICNNNVIDNKFLQVGDKHICDKCVNKIKENKSLLNNNYILNIKQERAKLGSII